MLEKIYKTKGCIYFKKMNKIDKYLAIIVKKRDKFLFRLESGEIVHIM